MYLTKYDMLMMRSVIHDYVIHKHVCDNCIIWMDKLHLWNYDCGWWRTSCM